MRLFYTRFCSSQERNPPRSVLRKRYGIFLTVDVPTQFSDGQAPRFSCSVRLGKLPVILRTKLSSAWNP